MMVKNASSVMEDLVYLLIHWNAVVQLLIALYVIKLTLVNVVNAFKDIYYKIVLQNVIVQ